MSKFHVLKCDRPVFAYVAEGLKTFEVRKNDRGYEPGDRVLLREHERSGDVGYTGRCIVARIGYVLEGAWASHYGMTEDMCVFALLDVALFGESTWPKEVSR